MKETAGLLFPGSPQSLRRVERGSIPLRDISGWSIDMLEPVSIIRLLAVPSISSEIEGARSSNRPETVGLMTAFTGVSSFRELSTLLPLIRYVVI